MIDDNSDKSEPERRSGPDDVAPVIPVSEDEIPADPGPHPLPARDSLSQRLNLLADDDARERIAMTDLLDLMPGQALAALILIFAAPNVVPAPPGLSAILGWPLVYLTWQQMMAQRPWLPPIIARRSVSRNVFATLIFRVTPWLGRLEKLLRPRLLWLVDHRAERLIGALCLLLSVILLLPVPLGNMLPALAISLMMLGLLERDGLWTLIGAIVGIASFVLAIGVVYAMIKAAIFLLTRAFN